VAEGDGGLLVREDIASTGKGGWAFESTIVVQATTVDTKLFEAISHDLISNDRTNAVEQGRRVDWIAKYFYEGLVFIEHVRHRGQGWSGSVWPFPEAACAVDSILIFPARTNSS